MVVRPLGLDPWLLFPLKHGLSQDLGIKLPDPKGKPWSTVQNGDRVRDRESDARILDPMEKSTSGIQQQNQGAQEQKGLPKQILVKTVGWHGLHCRSWR